MKYPHDFDECRLQVLMQRVHPVHGKPDALKEVLSALNGIGYRFSACATHDDAFKVLFADDANAPQTRYLQERELFEFLVTGQSAIECAAFASYMYASCLQPAYFVAKPRAIELGMVAAAFELSYSAENLTQVLTSTKKADEWKFWKEARSTLVHRSHPGRNFSNVGPTKWLGVEFGINFTSDRRKWLASVVDNLLRGIEAFAHAHPV